MKEERDLTRARIDHRVYKAWTEVALRDALARETGWRQAVSDADASGDPVTDFAAYLERALPVVTVISYLPYVEHLVEELVRDAGRFLEPVRLPALLSGSWQSRSQRSLGPHRILVLSFHEPGESHRILPLVHNIETTDSPVLIGCDHLAQIPTGYHRLIDLQLTLKPLDATRFRVLFEKLFASPLPVAEGEDARWQDFVMPADLQPPLRLGYPPDEAARYIRERVGRRLHRMSAEDAPPLAALHGLGEARRIALDLKEDIRLARAGRIEWREVDRGLLLVGPPGTGKTTLARALARECGIRFLSVSAADWQSADGLGLHVAAIRETFEEARRHAPAILFIDEIDAIGNRERMSGASQTYQATVTNYLLEQLDGFTERGELIVIGATNHEEMVDPALRRAGRLDQVVRISYPTVRALAGIYAWHLAPHAEAGRLADGIDIDGLARLSFGLTGADVERFVRGAARRARKRRDRIRQEDLLAEILHRPRAGDALSTPLDEVGIRRLAVHEAGHAMLRLLGPRRGEEIGYLSIAPRSDGRIGYLATVEDERASWTREDYLHEIRVLLAGRAAEALVYGRGEVSELAGNHGEQSDLARATRIARHLLGSAGLADDGLLWYPALPESLQAPLAPAVTALLHRLHEETLDRLAAHRPLLETITDRLVAEQEIDGDSLRALIS